MKMTMTRPTAEGWYWYCLPGSWEMQPCYVFPISGGMLCYTLDPIGIDKDYTELNSYDMDEAHKAALWSDEPLKTPNVRSQATDAALSRQVACTDGLGVAVPPAPTFENGGKHGA